MPVNYGLSLNIRDCDSLLAVKAVYRRPIRFLAVDGADPLRW